MQVQSRIKVWDRAVRVGHWALVVAFIIAFITEEDILLLHVWAGYAVLLIVTIRILWGIIGSQYARFTNFVTSPKVALQYLKDTLRFKAKRYIGHNPAGGFMIVIMVVSLILTTITGIAIYGVEDQAGPMAGWFASNSLWEDIFEEVHEFLANFTLVLVVIHVAGVLIESLIHKENLVKAMIDGTKKASH
ncbi:MAG: cytochrome b/b6 domain-containing protein [Gammaproteobacteria bacterium]